MPLVRKNRNICIGKLSLKHFRSLLKLLIVTSENLQFLVCSQKFKKFLTWEVSKWQFDPRVIITGSGAGWRGGNALPAKSFRSTVILCTPTLYKGMYILQRESIYSYLSFLELCSIAV